MARKDKRYTIYPHPRSIAILGETSGLLNLSIDLFAILISQTPVVDFNERELLYIADVLDAYNIQHDFCAAFFAKMLTEKILYERPKYDLTSDDVTKIAAKIADLTFTQFCALIMSSKKIVAKK